MEGIDFELIAESVPQIVWTAAADGTVDYFNARGMEYSGMPSTAIGGWNWLDLIHPDDRDRVERTWRETVAAGTPFADEYRIHHRDGTYRWNNVQAMPVRDVDRNIIKWIGTIHDVDDHRTLQARLQSAQRQAAETVALLETLQATAPVGFGFIDRDFRVARINDALAAPTRVPAERLIGQRVADVIPELWSELEPIYRRVLEHGEPVVNRETSGWLTDDPSLEQTWLTSFYPVRLEGKVIGIGIVLVDITDRKEAERKLTYLAERDPLTGLYNRRKLLTELDRILSYSVRYQRAGAVLLLDIDNFKWTNDSHGHATGDSLLASAAQILSSRMRETDLVARIGGDEFAVVLPEAGKDQAQEVASRLRFVLCERPIGAPIYASIGIALFSGAEKGTVDDLLAAADMAMYQVKEAGGDNAAVYEGPSIEVMTRVGAIHAALADHRFVLYGQPIVDLRTRETVATELLIRMRSDAGDLIPPSEFLPLAERFSIVVSIDRHVVEQALGMAHDQRVTVNLSGRSVGDPMILNAVRRAITAGLDPKNIVFELTESAVITDFERALHFVTALNSLGCDLALDDFGTGFGSFTYLKHLPARYLKVAQEFVRGVNADELDKEIVRSVADIARALKRQTIAEGVENEQVLETLCDLGIDFAQGFHLGRPAPFAPSSN